MTGFWNSGTGREITGDAKDAFVKDFSIIPEGTVAQAKIMSFNLIEKEFEGVKSEMYEIGYKLTDGDFKNREVSQKIKPFSGKPEAIDRNLNMLKLVMTLCNFRPTHNNAPTDNDLLPMIGNIVSIKIREFSSVGKDGKLFEINFVSEVYKAGSVATETGEKAIITHSPAQPSSHVDSALNRNAGSSYDVPDDSIPF